MNQAAGFSIASWHFLLISLSAIFLFRSSRSVFVKQALLLVFNLYFCAILIPAMSSLGILAGFLVFIWLISRWRLAQGRRWSALATVFLISGLLFFLFCVRDHDVFSRLNPFRNSLVHIVGISYMVFRSISYFFDIEFLDDRRFLTFLNYILFFPTLLAGPIARQDQFLASLEKSQPLSADQVLACSHRLVNGLIKKFVFADMLNAFVPTPESFLGQSPLLLWFGALLCLFVIYLDFGGYCDIVISIAKLMGIELPENFDRPFLARNIQEFWNRWHMSLSSIVRDYFFMPIARTLFANFPRANKVLLITLIYSFCLVLIALWHGTTAGFFFYGLCHAGALIVLQVVRYLRGTKTLTSFKSADVSVRRTLGDWISIAATYVYVSVTLTLSAFSGDTLWPMIQRLLGR